MAFMRGLCKDAYLLDMNSPLTVSTNLLRNCLNVVADRGFKTACLADSSFFEKSSTDVGLRLIALFNTGLIKVAVPILAPSPQL